MIRLSRRIRRFARVSAALGLLAGCASPRVDVAAPPADRPIAVRPGRAGFVVAAPHATRDGATGDIAAEIARRTGFGLVIASGFASPDDGPHRPGGRQGESGPDDPSRELTEAARRHSEAYEARVREAAQGPVRFYAELHGHRGQPCVGQLEIGTVGVDHELALRLRALAELIRDAHLRANRGVQRLDVLVEPVDAVPAGSPAAARGDILRLPERGLQIELPHCARRDWRETYVAILSDFLAQAVALSSAR